MNLSNREKRQFKKALIRQLSNSDLANPQTVADTLADTGIGDKIESILPLLQEPNSFDILYIADRLATGQKSTHTIVAAS